MNERWMPVLAGIVGVVGGVGGAYVGGAVANRGQEQQFEKSRAAQLQDVRKDAYVKYVRELATVGQKGGTSEGVDTAEAEVSLLSSAAVRKAAAELRMAVERSNPDAQRKLEQFYTEAQQELLRSVE